MRKFEEILSKKVYIIAEMSANHAGMLQHALEIVRAAKEAGADCLKIQTYTPDTLTIPCENEYFKIKGGLWDGSSLYHLYEKAYTPWEWHKEIKMECEKVGLDFLSTPFDNTAVDFLEELGVEFYKIASFELVDIPLIRYVAKKKKPIIMSCGMANETEINEAVEAARSEGNDEIILLKCCSEYPANYDDMNLATIPYMAEIFGLPIGLSDHSMGYIADVIAVALGARVIEKHFCITRDIENPDSKFSMEFDEFKEMVKQVRDAKKIVGLRKCELSEAEKASLIFRKSIFAVKDIKAGDIFTEKNIRVIRPGYGIKPKYYETIKGMNASKDIKRGEPISFDLINGVIK